jgi:hypothetical protein
LDLIMNRFENENWMLCRFKIVSKRLYYSTSQTHRLASKSLHSDNKTSYKYQYIVSILHKIAKFINDVDFIISLQDYCPTTEILPILTFSKDNTEPYEKYNILIPDWLTLRGKHKHTWNNIKTRLNINRTTYDTKINKIIWRGTNNKPCRNTFIDIALKNKDIINYANDYIDQADHLLYKYQVVFDGARCTWPGYIWRLYSGCLTIKHESNEVQWFYSALKPYIHYVPLKETFNENDVRTLHKWLIDNDKECKIITKNAEDFIKNYMEVEDMLGYYIAVLNTYAKIQKCTSNVAGFQPIF